MYSQYIPHFPTRWLTKDERSLLYKYFILNPSLCRISSIVSSHLWTLYIVPKSADVGKGCVLARSPAAAISRELGEARVGSELWWPGPGSFWHRITTHTDALQGPTAMLLEAAFPQPCSGYTAMALQAEETCFCLQPSTWVRTGIRMPLLQ